MFDWPRFLDAHQIDYVTSGPNVAGGNIAIHCPWCGAEDPSHHLSVSLTGAGYRCWRKHDHRGKNPTRLVMALLECSWEHAANLTGTNQYIDHDWRSRVSDLLEGTSPPEATPLVSLPRTFRPFLKPDHVNSVIKPYFDYMRDRGFRKLAAITRRYQVYFATQGPWKGRIIFAVYCNKQLVSWTGRTIWPSVEPRYKALTTDPDKARRMGVDAAVNPLPHYLLWYDFLRQADGRTLYICEGPFDALKVAELGRKHGIVATCLFTSEPSASQLDYLHEIVPRYRRCYSLLDAGTLPAAIKMTSALAGLGIGIKSLPKGIKDPGELREDQLLAL